MAKLTTLQVKGVRDILERIDTDLLEPSDICTAVARVLGVERIGKGDTKIGTFSRVQLSLAEDFLDKQEASNQDIARDYLDTDWEWAFDHIDNLPYELASLVEEELENQARSEDYEGSFTDDLWTKGEGVDYEALANFDRIESLVLDIEKEPTPAPEDKGE